MERHRYAYSNCWLPFSHLERANFLTPICQLALQNERAFVETLLVSRSWQISRLLESFPWQLRQVKTCLKRCNRTIIGATTTFVTRLRTFSLGKTATDANEHRLFISTSVVPDVHERWFSEFTLLDRSTSIDFSPIFHEAKECNQCGTINFFDANNFLMDLGALSPPFRHVSCSCDATTWKDLAKLSRIIFTFSRYLLQRKFSVLFNLIFPVESGRISFIKF